MKKAFIFGIVVGGFILGFSGICEAKVKLYEPSYRYDSRRSSDYYNGEKEFAIYMALQMLCSFEDDGYYLYSKENSYSKTRTNFTVRVKAEYRNEYGDKKKVSYKYDKHGIKDVKISYKHH